jgi:hypothetical protein
MIHPIRRRDINGLPLHNFAKYPHRLTHQFESFQAIGLAEDWLRKTCKDAEGLPAYVLAARLLEGKVVYYFRFEEDVIAFKLRFG